MKYVLAAALAVCGLAAPALALRPCDTTDIQCHRTCTLPHFDGRKVYFVQC